jgi:hypothetical protein
MSHSKGFRPWPTLASSVLAVLALCAAPAVNAQSEGGLYIAGEGFGFDAAAERALAQNPGGRRFFLLSLPAQAAALSPRATPAQVALRERVIAGNGVLLVCQRDLDNGRLRSADLVDAVVAVRGWPAKGSAQLPHGERYFADENRAVLPSANEALRTLRATCS